MDEDHVRLQDAVLLIVLVDKGLHELKLQVELMMHLLTGE